MTGTAYWIAAARARESARPDRLFDDLLAGALAGDRGRQILARSEQGGVENAFLPVRTRFLDDLLVGWLGGRHGQVVLLGAGLDTRAFRLELPGLTHVFELDHAELLAEKTARLADLGAVPRCRRTVVPADLTGPWADALRTAPFDPSVRTLWMAEGLLFHLAPVQVDELLATTAALSAPGSAFAADLFGTGLLALPGLEETVRLREAAGRPAPFCHDDPAGLFGAAGWSAVEVVPAGSDRANYGRLAGTAGTPGNATLRAHLVRASR